MISALHLLWIVPLAAMLGALMLGLVSMNKNDTCDTTFLYQTSNSKES